MSNKKWKSNNYDNTKYILQYKHIYIYMCVCVCIHTHKDRW